jgi:Protein of unknown function (DUF2949)
MPMPAILSERSLQARLIQFLQDELEVAPAAIALALKQREPVPHLLPIILWQYGLVTLDQYDQILNWLYRS